MNRDMAAGRMERELRRRQLAVRLMGHQARTQTIQGFTGLTRHQLATIRRCAGVSKESRFRGPLPTAFEDFFSSAKTRNESAVLALVYCALGAPQPVKRNGSAEALIERGERLCHVYETWHRIAPASDIEFEELMLLGEGVMRTDRISFRHCGACQGIIVIDLLGTRRRLCDHCARARREDLSPSSHPGRSQEDDVTDLVLYGLQLLGGQLLGGRKDVMR